MARLKSLEYASLKDSGDNYLQCALDTEINLKARDLFRCIESENECSERSKATAHFYMRRHMDENLKLQYLHVDDPLELWTELKNRFGYKEIVLPKAQEDWETIRIDDFDSLYEYHLELFKIATNLKICGIEVTEEDLIEKTLSTFHTDDELQQQQIRERSFKTYVGMFEWLSEILKKNAETNMVHLDDEGHENDDSL